MSTIPIPTPTPTPTPTPAPAPKKQFICSHCQRSFGRLEHLKRHERSHRNEKPFQCPLCQSTFVRRDMLKRHLRNVHKDVNTDALVIKPDSFKDGSKPSGKVGKAASVIRSQDVRVNVLGNLSKKGISLQPLPLPKVAPFVQGANSNANNILQISAIDKQLPVATPLSTTPLTTASSDSDSTSDSSSDADPTYFQFLTSSAISGNRQLEDLQLHVSPFLHYMNLSNVYENLSGDIQSLINIRSHNFIEILINFTFESLICGNYEDLLTILIKLNELPLDLSHLLLVNFMVNGSSGMFNAASSHHQESLGSLDCLIRANCQTLINRLQNLVGLQQLQLQQHGDELALAEVYKLVSYYKLNHGGLFNFELKYRYFVENSQRIFKLDLHGLLLNIKQKLLGCVDNLQGNQAEILMLTLANELSYHVVIQDDSLILQSLAQLQSRSHSNSNSNSHSSNSFQSTLTKVLNSEFPHFSKILESLTFDNELLWKCHFNLICDPNEPSRLSKDPVTNTTKGIIESLCVSIIIQLLACKSSLDGSQLRQIQRFKPMISTCLTELITRLKMGTTYFEGQFPLLSRILTLFLSNSYYHLQFIVDLKNGITLSSNELMKPSSVTIPASLHTVLVQAKNPPPQIDDKPEQRRGIKSLKIAKDPNYIHKSINPPTLSNVNLPSLGTILPRSILTNSPPPSVPPPIPQYDFKLTRSHSLNSGTMIVPLNSSSSALSPRTMDRSSSSSTVQMNYKF